jgi:hypothetical protein
MLGVTVPDIHRSLDKAAQATMIPAARVRGIYIDAARLEQYEQALVTAAIWGRREGDCDGGARSGAEGSTVAPFPHPAHRTGHADLPHPALGQDLTPSVDGTSCPSVGARSARRGARVDSSRPFAA